MVLSSFLYTNNISIDISLSMMYNILVKITIIIY